MKCTFKKIVMLIGVISLTGFLSENTRAQAQATNLITGRMYAVYFLTMSVNTNAKELSQMEFMFNEDGSVSAMDMKGHGLYLAGSGFFVSTYFADNAVMNFEMMDIFAVMSGITLDPLITGVGFFLIDYVNVVPFVFTGRELAE